MFSPIKKKYLQLLHCSLQVVNFEFGFSGRGGKEYFPFLIISKQKNTFDPAHLDMEFILIFICIYLLHQVVVK